MMNDQIRSKNAEQTKNCGIKIDYKNCASRLLLALQDRNNVNVSTSWAHFTF